MQFDGSGEQGYESTDSQDNNPSFEKSPRQIEPLLKAQKNKASNPSFGVPLIEVANLGDIEKETNLFNSQRSRDYSGQAKVIRTTGFLGSPGTTTATSKHITESR